jgi:hypothetical protein
MCTLSIVPYATLAVRDSPFDALATHRIDRHTARLAG